MVYVQRGRNVQGIDGVRFEHVFERVIDFGVDVAVQIGDEHIVDR
jgi:hypothetical protein